jgi:hypothetical protein
MAMVFPACSVIGKLVKATVGFDDCSKAFEAWRIPLFQDALEELRQMALLNPNVLLRRKLSK